MKLGAVVMISVPFLVGGEVSISQGELFGAPTFNGSMVKAIEQTGLNLTIRIMWGRARISLPVVSSEVLREVAVGDRVSLELDPEGRVIRVVTSPDSSRNQLGR